MSEVVRALCCFHCYGMSLKSSWLRGEGLAHSSAGCWNTLKDARGGERSRGGERRETVCVQWSAFLYACDNRSPMAYDDEWVRPSKSVCFCERNGAFKGLFTLRVYEMCVCVCVCVCVDPAGQNSLVGMSRNTPSPSFSHTHTHIYISHKEHCLMRDFGERSEKKGEERECFEPGEGVKTFLGKENGVGVLETCVFQREVSHAPLSGWHLITVWRELQDYWVNRIFYKRL